MSPQSQAERPRRAAARPAVPIDEGGWGGADPRYIAPAGCGCSRVIATHSLALVEAVLAVMEEMQRMQAQAAEESVQSVFGGTGAAPPVVGLQAEPSRQARLAEAQARRVIECFRGVWCKGAPGAGGQ